MQGAKITQLQTSTPLRLYLIYTLLIYFFGKKLKSKHLISCFCPRPSPGHHLPSYMHMDIHTSLVCSQGSWKPLRGNLTAPSISPTSIASTAALTLVGFIGAPRSTHLCVWTPDPNPEESTPIHTFTIC